MKMCFGDNEQVILVQFRLYGKKAITTDKSLQINFDLQAFSKKQTHIKMKQMFSGYPKIKVAWILLSSNKSSRSK